MTRRAPITLTSTISVPRPAEAVASFVLDWGNDAQWRSQVAKFIVDPPGRAVEGQRLVEHLRFAGMPFRTPTVIDSAGLLEAAYSGGSRSVRVSGWRKVTATSTSTSRVVVHTEIELTGALGLLAPVLAGSYRRTDQADVARLAAVVERALG